MPADYPPGPNDHLLGFRTLRRMKADVLGSYAALHRDYGDSVSFRTGPYRLFVFFHPDQVREVLVTYAKSLIRLPRVMRTFAQWNGDSILIAERRPWIQQRRLVQQGFQPRRMAGYGDAMVAATLQLVESWKSSIDFDGHIDVDIDAAMTALTLSIVCRTLFDSDVTEDSAEIGQAVAVLSDVAFDEMQAPVRLPMWMPTPQNRRKRWAMDVLDRVVWKFVRQRRDDGIDHGDLLSMLLAAVDDEDPSSRLDDQQVRNEAMTLMLAGHDTTAAGFDWLWYNLAKFPEVARRCQVEIDEVAGGRDATAADVEQLPYLYATVKETLRLYPPAIGIFLRQTTKDLQIGGYQVPAKSLITLSSFVTQRDPRWFDQPEEFIPDRFLPPVADDIPAGAYFPFGAGPRVCIGQSFAMTEMTLVAATLLARLDVAQISGDGERSLDVKMALRPKKRLQLRFTRRDR